MPIDHELIEDIHANTALVRKAMEDLDGAPLGLDRASVERVAVFLERRRLDDRGAAVRMVGVIGSFLGDAIAAATGARWDMDDEHGVGLRFDSGALAFPLTKTHKAAEEGPEGGESIVSFYDVCCQVVATGRLGERPS